MQVRHHRTKTLIGLLLLAVNGVCLAQERAGEQTWTRVQYHGGALGVEETSRNWKNRLTVSPGAITLTDGKRVFFEIPPDRVTALAYQGVNYVTGKEVAYHSVLEGAFALIPGLFLLHQKDHFLAIEYKLPDGRPSAVLLRLHKENFRQIQEALHAVTGIEKKEAK
jgi:hypothetical protein